MKIQCSCGAKYELDVTPGMPAVHFVCRNCGQDYSAFVNDLIGKELGRPAPTAPLKVAAPAVPQAPPSLPPPPPAAPAAAAAPRLRINRGHEPAAAAPAAPPQQEQAAPVSKYCPKHHEELATGVCEVCQKPICPKCMDTFGNYCSAFCRNKVEGASMDAPSFGGRRFDAQRVLWRKVRLISTVVGVIGVAVFGFWFWYAWIGSAPRVRLAVSFDAISHTGSSQIVGEDQVVFLHGGTLARYNLQNGQKVWSLDLVTQEMVDEALKKIDEESAKMQHETGHASSDELTPTNLRTKHARIDLESMLTLYVAGKNIWIAKQQPQDFSDASDMAGGNVVMLTRYDWDSGNVAQTVLLTNSFGELTAHGNELLAVGQTANGAQSAMHFSLDDGSTHTEELLGTTAAAPAIAQNVPVMQAQPQGGLPISPRDQGRPLDPRRVQEQAQNMSYAGRLALPALLGNSQHNAQINQEVAQEDRDNERQNVPAQRRAPAPRPKEVFDTQSFTLIPDGDSYVAFASRMLQENVVEREAMKAAPTKSALDSSDLSAANEQKAVNEQLNDIQRQNGGDKVSEDLSTYQVALRRPGQNEPDWIGEIVGPPQFFPLTTVNVLAAGKTVMVFDKSNKRLWQDQTTYDVTGSEGQSESTEFGKGPCVENNNTLYVFDQAVLTAYDPTSGNVRWRIPSVGVVGLFFDDKGMVYVNTTTGNPDDIKYSRQIDINKDTQTVVMKVDPANGNILWRSSDGGFISYLSGKFIYAYRSYDAGDSDEQLMDATAGLTAPSYLKIIRINAANGHVMWEHDEDHGPVDVQFDRNIITLVLKKQVEVLKFFTF